jgi:hypothetical protein
VDYSVPNPGPTIKAAFFPNTQAFVYWSSTNNIHDEFSKWGVSFVNGSVYNYDPYNNTYVRCVRGQSPGNLVDKGNGTVLDSRTGLTWQKCSFGQNNDSTCSGTATPYIWGEAISSCEGSTLANHSNWRLPNVRELQSLTDDSRYNPTIDTSYFPNAHASGYWSSTTYASNPSSAWNVDFYAGSVYNYNKVNNYYVRCVCGGRGSLVNLTITKEGHGMGSVSANTGSISWSGNTGTASSLYGAQVTLSPNPDATSIFAGWSGGGCSGTGNCSFTMNGDNAVTATFILKPARIAGSTTAYFTVLQLAYDTAASGNTIEAQGIDFPESLTVNKPLTLIGGYDNSYYSNSGFTMVKGLTIGGGSLTVENLQIH